MRVKDCTGMIHFLVDRLHVATSDLQLCRHFRSRMNLDEPPFNNRRSRKALYRIALKHHHANQQIVRRFHL